MSVVVVVGVVIGVVFAAFVTAFVVVAVIVVRGGSPGRRQRKLPRGTVMFVCRNFTKKTFYVRCGTFMAAPSHAIGTVADE